MKSVQSTLEWNTSSRPWNPSSQIKDPAHFSCSPSSLSPRGPLQNAILYWVFNLWSWSFHVRSRRRKNHTKTSSSMFVVHRMRVVAHISIFRVTLRYPPREIPDRLRVVQRRGYRPSTNVICRPGSLNDNVTSRCCRLKGVFQLHRQSRSWTKHEKTAWIMSPAEHVTRKCKTANHVTQIVCLCPQSHIKILHSKLSANLNDQPQHYGRRFQIQFTLLSRQRNQNVAEH